MSDPWPFIFVLIVLALIGALVSLLALLPPVRKVALRSLAARIAAILILGLLSLVLAFGLLTRLMAEAVYAFGTVVIVDTFNSQTSTVVWPYDINKPAIVNELWIRLLVPPPFRQACYTNEATMCALVNDILPATSADWSWKGYLVNYAAGFVSVVTSTGLVWLFTRQRHSFTQAAHR